METKKNKKYDLEPKRPLFFGVGMIISLSLALFAFEWKLEIEPIVLPQEPEIEEIIILLDPIVTEQKIPEPPKPIKQEKQVINLATDIIEVKDELFEPKEAEVIDQGEELVENIDTPINLPIEDPDEVFIVVEEKPFFPGGEKALLSYIAKNLRYPSKAQRMGIEGRVIVQFVIDKDGSVTDLNVLKGIGAGCDEEALRVMGNIPKFSPGKQRGKPVKVQMQVPILFRLN